MKKRIICLLSITMVLGLAGCNTNVAGTVSDEQKMALVNTVKNELPELKERAGVMMDDIIGKYSESGVPNTYEGVKGKAEDFIKGITSKAE